MIHAHGAARAYAEAKRNAWLELSERWRRQRDARRKSSADAEDAKKDGGS